MSSEETIGGWIGTIIGIHFGLVLQKRMAGRPFDAFLLSAVLLFTFSRLTSSRLPIHGSINFGLSFLLSLTGALTLSGAVNGAWRRWRARAAQHKQKLA